MAGLHFDATYNNEDVMRKVRESQKAFAELASTAEAQGKRIDAAFEKISLKSLERAQEIMKGFPKEVQGISSFQKQLDGLEKQIERVNQRITSVGSGKTTPTLSDTPNINIGDVLKQQVYVGSQSVNTLTEKIIQQKILIKDIEGDVRALGEAYRRAGEGTTKGNALFADVKSAKAALQEEKNALFELQTQQAQARLSVRKLKDEQSLYQKEAQKVVESNESMSVSFKKALGVIGGVAALKQLGSEIIKVRGEFQAMQTAIETLVGKDMAGNLIPQIKELAKVSPLTLSDMVSAEKMMLGFNIKAEDTIRYLQALGDISMGNSQKFNSLTLAFSQMSATGKLMGQDLNQMINAGFNPLQTISEKTGKSIATLKEEMSKGVISTEMVQKAFIDATSEGGRFFGMSENASKTINGQLSMMQDALDEVFNEIGTKGEDAIMSGIQATTSLIQNYETVGKVLTGLIATFGVYKAATIAYYAISKTYGIYDIATKELQFVATMKNIAATKALAVQQAILNKAAFANPYVLVATLVVGAAAAMWAFYDSTTAAEKAQSKFNDELDKFKQKEDERKQKIESLIRTIQDETETEFAKVKAYEELQRLSPTLTDAYKREELAVASLADTNKELNKVRDVESYDNIIANIENYKKKVQELAKERDRYKGVKSDFAQDQYVKLDAQVEANEKMLARYNTQLDTYNRLKKEAEENAKPVEIRLKAAKENETNIKEALETIDNLLLAKKREFEGHEIKVPLSMEGAAQEAESFEDKMKTLKAKVEGDDIKIPFKPNEHLDQIPSLFEKEKDNWINAGAFTIPLSIEIERNKITSVLDAVQKTIAALTGSSSQTYKEAYDTAKSEWKAAQKALEESKKKSKVDYINAKKNLDEKETNFKDLGGVVNTAKQEESAAEKNRKKQESIREQKDKNAQLEKKQSIDRQRQQQDLENQATQASIDASSDGFEKIQAQRDLNNKKEIQALERQKEDYINAVIQLEKEKFDAEEELKAKEDSKHVRQTFDSSTVKVDTSAFDGIIGNTSKRQLNDKVREQEDSWDEYLIKYGTFTQKKEAIDRKYRNLIKEAPDAGKAASLQKEWEESVANLDLSKLKQEINWEMIFGDLSKVTKDQLKNIKNQLQEFKKSPEFQKATPEQIQVIEDAFNSINNAMVDKGGFFGGMVDSVNELKQATEELKKAEEELAKANKSGTDAQKEEAQKKANKAKQRQQNAETNVTKSSDKTIDHLTAVGNAIAQLGSSAEMSLSSFGNAAGSIVDTFTEAGSKIGGMVGAIFSILDGIQQQGLDGFVGNILGSVAGAVGGILDIVTFGVLGIGGADYSNYNEMKEQYETISSIWDELISKKSEYLEIGTTEERKRTEQEILDLIGRQEQTDRNMGKERLNSGASTGSRSIGVRMKRGISDEGWSQWNNFADANRINRDLGGRMEGLFDLTSKQLEELKLQAPDFWAKMDDDVRRYLNDIIECGDQTEETIEKAKELWAGISFDSLVDNFKSALADMDSSAEDFADDFQQYLMNAIIDSFVNGDEFQKKLKDWHNKFAEFSKSDGELNKDEKEELKKDWDKMVQDGLDYRNNLFESMGFDSTSSSSQNSTQKGFEAMSQDTGEELNGRFTALQISNEEIKNSMLSMLTGVNNISTATVNNGITLSEIRNIAMSSNNYLGEISGCQKKILTNFGRKLDSMESLFKQFNSK